MKKYIAPAFALPVLLLGAACTGPAEDPTGDVDVTTQTLPGDADMEEEMPEDADMEESAPADDGTAVFGEPYSWEDGVSINVENLGEYTPGDTDAYEPGFTTHRVFTITVKNGGDQPIDLSGGTIQGVSGGAATDEVFGTYQGIDIGGFPYNSLLPGKTQSFNVAFGVMDPEDMQIEVSPDWDHDYAIFVS